MHRTQSGLEHLLDSPLPWLQGKRLGLLCNPASVDHRLVHARMGIHAVFPGQLRCLFSPQHGFFAEKQDNMVESSHMIDPVLGIPVYSLYGATRTPTQDMLDGIDVLLVDLQDAGTRVYTFIYTLSHCMEAVRDSGKRVVVLDRPNPVGGTSVEGNVLAPGHESFVGRYPIPMRHGLTIGELARLFNTQFGIGAELDVVPMKGWERWMGYPDTGLNWVAPSPNLPTPTSALVYPGQVIWEGTNISEGRGTTQPFELFGAPFIDPGSLLRRVGANDLAGVILRPAAFEPTSNKWAGKVCRGFQMHVDQPGRFLPYRTSLSLLQAVCLGHGEDFTWSTPPYEYEYERMPIDLILGDRALREAVGAGVPIADLERSWQDGLDAFAETRRDVLMY